MNKNSVGAAVFIFIFLAEAGVAAPRRPLNYRWKKKSAVSTSTSTVLEEYVEPEAAKQRLLPGKWTPEARAAIETFIAERGKGAKGYDAAKPPVAVLPWSDALVSGDPAELVFLRLTARADFKFDDSWWEIVPVGYGRQPARAAYDSFIALSTATWAQQPEYMRYRKTLLESYLSLCRGVGRKECRSYLARLWAGWREDDAMDYAKAALAEEKARLATKEEIKSEEGDPAPLKTRRGLRLVPAARDLVNKLRAAGVDVWVVDDVPQPVLLASAADYGVDPTRVLGIKNVHEGSRLSASVAVPVPTRGGKAEAVKAAVGRPPDLVLGRDAADAELMMFGSGIRIALTGDPDLEKKARESGWLLQPALVK